MLCRVHGIMPSGQVGRIEDLLHVEVSIMRQR